MENPRHLGDHGGLNVLGKIKNILGNEYLNFVIILRFAIQYSCFTLLILSYDAAE